MSEATQTPEGRAPRKRATSLSTMLLADLKALAGGLGIDGAAGMKKAQLVDAIKSYQDQHASVPRTKTAPAAPAEAAEQPQTSATDDAGEKPVVTSRTRGKSRAPRAAEQEDLFTEQAEKPAAEGTAAAEAPGEQEPGERPGRNRNRNRNRDRQNGEAKGGEQSEAPKKGGNAQNDAKESKDQRSEQGESRQNQNRGEGKGEGQKKGGNAQNNGGQGQSKNDGGQGQSKNDGAKNDQQQAHGHNGGQGVDDDFDDEGGSRRNRRRRGRDRAERGRNEPDTTILDDDVLVPAAGILDVLDNYAFVRTSGYLPGPDDVYLSLSMVRKYGLRRGDAVVGQVRQPREGERREKFNPMVRVDQVNGVDPEAAKERPEFDQFVPVHPSTRLRLETGPDNLLGRIVDVLAPIGKGQRGMVLSPPRSGKTQVLQTIAAAIRHNNPECHVMVVLIDERPEEVTDYQRTVRGEVVASTFDRPAADHVLLAELAVERAKRLVELGHDVVVLLDSLTRLARAFNVTAPGSGRQGAGGVDPVALHPAKRLFGAARNIEDGGSLTILATALVDSGSPLDEAVLDEFNDTGNMELRLRRELVERRIFPPVDVVTSGTRREEQLLSPEEQQLMFKFRSALTDLEPRDALEKVVARMTSTTTNVEFLAQVAKASPAELAGK